MKNRPLFVLASLMVILTMLVAGCAPAEPEVPTLRVWITWGDNPAQIQALFDRYGEANGVRVEVTAPVEVDQVLTALSSSTPPDILVLSGGDLVKSYSEENLVTPLNDIITQYGIDLEDIYPASLGQCVQDGVYLCLPWGADVYGLFWNRDMFEAAGLDPDTPPQTMEQLVEYARALTITNADGTLAQVGFIPDFSWSHTDLYAAMFGGFWYNADGTEVTVNSQPMVDALLWAQQFYTEYGTDNLLSFGSSLGGYMSPDQGFYAGRVAMMVDGEWQVGPNFIPNYRPDLNYGVGAFPPPADHPERAGTVVVQGTVVVIPSGAADQAASARLLAWMLSPEILAEEMCANANLPTSAQAAQQPCFADIPNFDVFINLISGPNATPVITTPISLELIEAEGLVEEQVLHAGADPVPLLDELQAQYAPLLSQALGQ